MKKDKPPSHTYGTLQHFKWRAWNSLNLRTINGHSPDIHNKNTVKGYLSKGIRLEITKDEFYSWCDLNSQEIMRLYKERLRPSLDRIDSSSHYYLSNIRVIPLSENSRLGGLIGGATRRKDLAKPIVGVSVIDGTVLHFECGNDAERTGGFFGSAISQCALGKRKTHNGYRWSFLKK